MKRLHSVHPCLGVCRLWYAGLWAGVKAIKSHQHLQRQRTRAVLCRARYRSQDGRAFAATDRTMRIGKQLDGIGDTQSQRMGIPTMNWQIQTGYILSGDQHMPMTSRITAVTGSMTMKMVIITTTGGRHAREPCQSG